MTNLTDDTRAFCKRMAIRLILSWREAGRDGLPKTRAWARQQALWWLSHARGRA